MGRALPSDEFNRSPQGVGGGVDLFLSGHGGL
jgi:hypothetical protein